MPTRSPGFLLHLFQLNLVRRSPEVCRSVTPGFLSSFSSILCADRLKRAGPSAGFPFQFSSILYADRLKLAGPSAGLPFSFSCILYADRLKIASLSAGFLFSSCTFFQCRSTRLTFGSKFLAWYCSKVTSLVPHRRGC